MILELLNKMKVILLVTKVNQEQSGIQNVLEVTVDLSVLPVQLVLTSMIILTDSVLLVKINHLKPNILRREYHLHFAHMNALVLEILMTLILNVLMSWPCK